MSNPVRLGMLVNQNLSKLTARSIKFIEQGKRIVLRRSDGWFLHCWTNIAGGPDNALWGRVDSAMEIFNLKWAFALAKLYGCKVYTATKDNEVELVKK